MNKAKFNLLYHQTCLEREEAYSKRIMYWDKVEELYGEETFNELLEILPKNVELGNMAWSDLDKGDVRKFLHGGEDYRGLILDDYNETLSDYYVFHTSDYNESCNEN